VAAKPSTKFIRKAIRDLIEPQIAALGFTGKYPEFRREVPGEIHFLYFFTAKYGGSFSYSAAWDMRGPDNNWANRTIAHADFRNRATVQCVTQLWTIDGTPFRAPVGPFEYRYMAEDEQACRALVGEAAATLPAVDQWLRTRQDAECLEVGGAKAGTAQNRALNWMIAQARAKQGLY
jgi:hypothetical protein